MTQWSSKHERTTAAAPCLTSASTPAQAYSRTFLPKCTVYIHLQWHPLQHGNDRMWPASPVTTRLGFKCRKGRQPFQPSKSSPRVSAVFVSSTFAFCSFCRFLLFRNFASSMNSMSFCDIHPASDVNKDVFSLAPPNVHVSLMSICSSTFPCVAFWKNHEISLFLFPSICSWDLACGGEVLKAMQNQVDQRGAPWRDTTQDTSTQEAMTEHWNSHFSYWKLIKGSLEELPWYQKWSRLCERAPRVRLLVC